MVLWRLEGRQLLQKRTKCSSYTDFKACGENVSSALHLACKLLRNIAVGVLSKMSPLFLQAHVKVANPSSKLCGSYESTRV